MAKHRIGPRGWMVVAGLALTIASAPGCDTQSSGTALKPEGPPEILQVFVTELNPDTGKSSLQLAYGCDFAALEETRECESGVSDDPSLCCERMNDKYLDTPDDGVVKNALAAGAQKIRIIFDELLRGSSLEQFECACASSDKGVAGCPNGMRAALSPRQCDDNGDTNAIETGKFTDVNVDGVPDNALLLPGIVSIDCVGARRPWINTEDDGWYNPSGNQFVPIKRDGRPNWDGVGPALVLTPPVLPTGVDCWFRFADSIAVVTPGGGMTTVVTGVDKDGEKIPVPAALKFTTQALAVTSTAPANNQSGVKADLKKVTITFNAPLDPDTVIDAQVSVASADGTLAGSVKKPLSAGNTTIEWNPAGALASTTRYTVTVGAGVTDSFGSALAESYVFTFKTK